MKSCSLKSSGTREHLRGQGRCITWQHMQAVVAQPAVACAHTWDQASEQRRWHNHASGHSWHRSPRQTAQPGCCNRRGSSKSGRGTRRMQGSEWRGGSSRDCNGKPRAPTWPTASAQVLTLDWAAGQGLLSLGEQILPVKLLCDKKKHRDITVKNIRESVEFFRKFRISSFKICYTAKQIATGLEIEIKLKIITFSRKEYNYHVKLQMNLLLTMKPVLSCSRKL